MLSEVGEDAIVILSTHIVEDVTSLCSDVAIIENGEVLTRGTPENIIHAVKGKIWKKEIKRAELMTYEKNYVVTSTNINQGTHPTVC